METDEQVLVRLGREIQNRIGGRVVMSVADAERVIAIASGHSKTFPATATAPEKLPLRPVVAWFAEQMERVLRRNDHKGVWDPSDIVYLRDRLREECVELEIALDADTFEKATDEAADVANFAMMIADSLRRTHQPAAEAPASQSVETSGRPASDLSRERLANCREALVEKDQAAKDYASDPSSAFAARRLDLANARVGMLAENHFEALLTMAERCVSEQTLKSLAESFEHERSMSAATNVDQGRAANRARDAALYWFCIGAQLDLKEPATELASKGTNDVR